MVAPVTQPARARPEVAVLGRARDCRPDRLERALEPHELVLVGRIGQRVAVGEVDELELLGHKTAGSPQHERVELHLEQGFGLERLARDRAGLVVDHADIARRGHVQAIDVATQPQSVDHRLDQLLAGSGFERCGVLQGEVALDEIASGVEPVAELPGLGVVGEQRRQFGRLREKVLPGGLDEVPGRSQRPLGGGQVVKLFEHRVHDGASRGRPRRRLGEPVDRAKAVQQWAGLEV